MKAVLDVGAILILLIIGFALYQKYAAEAITAANPQAIASLNRSNADTALMYDAGMTAINGLQSWIPQPSPGSQW